MTTKLDELVTTGLKNPDLFTPAEAAAYLHLDSERGLETLRREYGLIGYEGVNRAFLYYRDDLDRVVLRIVGRDRQWNPVGEMRLKIAGRRA